MAGEGGGGELFHGPVGRGKFGDGATGRKHDEAVAETHQLGHFAGDDDDGFTLSRKFPEQRMDGIFCGGIDSAGRLVKQQHRAIAEEPAAKHDFLLIAAAERGDRLPRGSAADP